MEILLSYLAFILLICLAWSVIQVIAHWQIYTKAGEAGWKSLIPIYSTYILYRITWNTTVFWIVSFISIAGTLLAAQTGSTFLVLLGRFTGLISIVIACINYHKLSLAFGHGVGFTLGLIFLNPIFIMILGFDSSKYLGPQN